ncbi:MAG: hypothetical protein OXI24_05430, partial [Candidatus Poribacteria bacterium]|nr:hypothetical protein [Candidatus Poribacteria bacterium]
SRTLLDVAVQEDYPEEAVEAWLSDMSDALMPDTAEIPPPESQVRVAMLTALVSGHLTMLLITLLSIKSIGFIEVVKLESIYAVLKRYSEIKEEP